MSKISNLINKTTNCDCKCNSYKDDCYKSDCGDFVESSHIDENDSIEDVFVDSAYADISSNDQKNDAVNHPSHYQSKNGIEAIDVIESFDLNFNLGNVVKYILRCGKKDADIQELKKARWYLNREITNRQKYKISK